MSRPYIYPKWYCLYDPDFVNPCDTCKHGAGGVDFPECDYFKPQYIHIMNKKKGQDTTNAIGVIGFSWRPEIVIVFRRLGERPEYNVTHCSYYECSPKVSYKQYMESSAWKEKRKAKLREADYKCERCGSAKNLTVHHLTYAHLRNEPLDDLIVLCWNCHNQIHRRDKEAAE